MGQITRTWRNGRIRFDSLSDMRNRYEGLREWSWANVYERADLQLLAIVLMSKSNYDSLLPKVIDPYQALYFADAAYNGGLGGVNNDRRACNMRRDCNPRVWFGNVERTCTKSRAALYGRRSACDINREHVTNVFRVRSNKYAVFFNQ